jgi:hypothetical protein
LLGHGDDLFKMIDVLAVTTALMVKATGSWRMWRDSSSLWAWLRVPAKSLAASSRAS